MGWQREVRTGYDVFSHTPLTWLAPIALSAAFGRGRDIFIDAKTFQERMHIAVEGRENIKPLGPQLVFFNHPPTMRHTTFAVLAFVDTIVKEGRHNFNLVVRQDSPNPAMTPYSDHIISVPGSELHSRYKNEEYRLRREAGKLKSIDELIFGHLIALAPSSSNDTTDAEKIRYGAIDLARSVNAFTPMGIGVDGSRIALFIGSTVHSVPRDNKLAAVEISKHLHEAQLAALNLL